MTSKRTYCATVYPKECDFLGHFNIASYVAAFDQATYQLFDLIGIALADDRANNIAWVDVRHVIDYRDELVAGELFSIYSCIEKVGRSSVSLVHTLKRNHKEESVAQACFTIVRFDLTERRSIAIPTDDVETFHRHLMKKVDR